MQTTLAKSLRKQLGLQYEIIHCDNYRRPKYKLRKYTWIDNNVEKQASIVDEPSAWLVGSLVEDIRNSVSECTDKVLLVEGFLLYAWPEVIPLIDLKLFIDVKEAKICFER